VLTDLVKKERARQWVIPAAGVLAHLGFSPNLLTVIGFLLNVGVALVIASGQTAWGGILLLAASGFDMFDGAVARLTNRVTPFGAFLDSTLDRFSEAVVLGSLLWLYAGSSDRVMLAVTFAATIGSLMVSYARARAEGLGLKNEVGFLARPERIVMLSLGLIIGWQHLALWIMAILTNVTVVQRVMNVWRQTR